METIETYKGNTPTITFTVIKDNKSFNLVNCTCYLAAKKLLTDESAIFVKTTADGTKDGIVSFTLTAEDTKEVVLCIAELLVVTGESKVITAIQFKLNIKQNVYVP